MGKFLRLSNGVAKSFNESGGGGSGTGPANVIKSGSSGNFLTSSASFVDVTNLTTTITTNGGQVKLELIPDGNNTVGQESGLFMNGTSNTAEHFIQILRGSTVIAQFNSEVSNSGLTDIFELWPVGGIVAYDTPVAGTYTYKVQMKKGSGSITNVGISYASLLTWEMAVGTGSSGSANNLITSTDSSAFEGNTVGSWARYQNTAQFEPIDGTGGTPSANLTFATTGTNPLNGTYSALLTKSGSANMQGYGVGLSVAIPLEYRGQKLELNFFYSVVSGTFNSSDLIVRMYDTTNGALIASNVESISTVATGVSGRFVAQFTPSTSCANVRVIIHQASTTTNNYSLSFDDFSLWTASVAGSSSFASTSWSGYHDTSYNNWYFNSTGSYADPSSNDSNGNQVIELDNNGFGSVVSNFTGARKLPGLIFAPPKLGRFKITASITVANTGGSYIAFQLVDGSTIIGEGSHNGSGTSGGITLEGLFNASDLTSRTITIKARVQSSSGTITNFGFQQSMITWNIESLNSVDGVSSGQSASAIYHYTDMHSSYASTNNKIPYWDNLIQNSDSSSLLNVVNSSTLGFSVTANRRCLVFMTYNITTNNATYFGISKNSTELTTDISGITRANQVNYQWSNANNYSGTIDACIVLEPGDTLRPHTSGFTTNSNSLNNVFVSAVEVPAPVGGTLSALGTAAYNFGPNASGLASTNTAIPYYSAINNFTDPSGLLDVSNSSTFGVSVTAKRDCLVTMTFPMSYNTADYKGISLNSTSLTTSIDSQTQAVTVAKTFSQANTITLITATVPMVAGDILRPHLTTGVTLNGYMLFVSAVETNVVVYGGTSNSSQTVENLGLTPTVGGSALTIAMKNATGSDPSSSSPVSIGMRSPTLTSGLFNLRKVQSPLSITIPSGATLGLESGSNGYIYAYALDNAGSIEMAVSSIWRDDSLLGTTTTISSSADNDGFYSATGRTSVPFRLIGRFRYSTCPNGTYSAMPDEACLLSTDLFAPEFQRIKSANKTLTGNNYVALTGNSITLQPGRYVLSGTLETNENAAQNTSFFGTDLYWALANGADNGSTPASILSSAKLTVTGLDHMYWDPDFAQAAQQNQYQFWTLTGSEITVDVNKTETIYLDSFMNGTNNTNVFIFVEIMCRRIKT